MGGGLLQVALPTVYVERSLKVVRLHLSQKPRNARRIFLGMSRWQSTTIYPQPAKRVLNELGKKGENQSRSLKMYLLGCQEWQFVIKEEGKDVLLVSLLLSLLFGFVDIGTG